MLQLLVLSLLVAAQAPVRDYARERRLVEGQIAAERQAAHVANQHQMLLRGMHQIAGRAGFDYASALCSSSWEHPREPQVGQICDSGGCVRVTARASERVWEGFISGCEFNLNSGAQCRVSFGFENSQALYGVYCTSPNLDQIDYRINAGNGRVTRTGFSKAPVR